MRQSGSLQGEVVTFPAALNPLCTGPVATTRRLTVAIADSVEKSVHRTDGENKADPFPLSYVISAYVRLEALILDHPRTRRPHRGQSLYCLLRSLAVCFGSVATLCSLHRTTHPVGEAVDTTAVRGESRSITVRVL